MSMCATIEDHLYCCDSHIRSNIFAIHKACYTGYLYYVKDFFNRLINKCEILYDILKTHNKINDLIESFNKDTNYKFKEIFENRDNYCEDYTECFECTFLSCSNTVKYYDLAGNENYDDIYHDFIIKVHNEFNNLLEKKVI